MRTAILPVLALALATLSCERVASTPDVEPLGEALGALPTGFVELTDAAWLGGRRWAVLSRPDSSVAIADFEAGTVTALGRGTVRQPYALFLGADDTLYAADWEARRIHAWATDGTPARGLPMPAETRGTLPAARDADGHWYVELRPPAGRDGSGLRDSTWLLRLAADGTVLERVAPLAPIDLAEVDGDRGRRFEPRVFAGRDLWGVHPDGGLWIARVNENRVDWLGHGDDLRRGVSLPDPVVQVTQPDRDLYMQRFPPELRSAAGRVPFAVFKPPFVHAFAHPPGGVWLEQSKAIADTTRQYLLVDERGDLARVVELPGYGHARAAAPDRVLVSRFRDGQVVVEELPLPAGPPAP